MHIFHGPIGCQKNVKSRNYIGRNPDALMIANLDFFLYTSSFVPVTLKIAFFTKELYKISVSG